MIISDSGVKEGFNMENGVKRIFCEVLYMDLRTVLHEFTNLREEETVDILDSFNLHFKSFKNKCYPPDIDFINILKNDIFLVTLAVSKYRSYDSYALKERIKEACSSIEENGGDASFKLDLISPPNSKGVK